MCQTIIYTAKVWLCSARDLLLKINQLETKYLQLFQSASELFMSTIISELVCFVFPYI